jgi:hypothetical protein
MNRKSNVPRWVVIIVFAAGFIMAWDGLIGLANRDGVKHAAFEVVLGFAFMMGCIVDAGIKSNDDAEKK